MPFRRLSAALAAVAALVALSTTATAKPAPKADPTCPASRCVDVTIPVPAGVRVSANHARVLLPVGYGSHKSARYPVVYMLNGALGDYHEWTQLTDITSYSAQLPAIFVFPDGGVGRDAGWFSDWRDGTWQWETWHIQSVLPWIDSHFRTDPSKRAIAGASMGANGALEYAGRHPDLFRTAAAFSGWDDTQLGTPVTAQVAASDASAPQDMSRIWGDQLLNADVWAQHNPTTLAKSMKGVTVFTSAGTGNYADTGTDSAHGGSREANLFLCIPTYLSALQQAGVDHHDLIYAGGTHSWPTFQLTMRWALPKMMDVLAGRPVVDNDPAPEGLARLPLGSWHP
jgi:diacylglycerol O-acyltransferase/trehalose O-mycolyltransferase